jgi:hypothetical protein
MSRRRRIPHRGDVAASAISDLARVPAPPHKRTDIREQTLPNFAKANCTKYTAGLGYFADGRLAEVFLNAEKIGTAIEAAARDSAVVASLALQHGVPSETIRHALTRNGDGTASGALGTLLDLLAKQEPASREPST